MWKDIKGYEGLYQINENGQVKSLKKYNRRSCDRTLKPDNGENGYQRVTLSKNNIQKRFLIHRLVYETFITEIPEGLVINHIDFNPKNNNINNLEVVTTCVNNRKKTNTRLNESKVKAIRQSHLTIKELAEIYNVSPRAINHVLNGDRWADV